MQNGLPFKFIHNRHRNYRDVMAVSRHRIYQQATEESELQRIVFAIPQKIKYRKKVSQKPNTNKCQFIGLLRFPHFIKTYG